MPVHDTVLEFDYDSDATATVVADSVRQEVGEIASDRSRTQVSRDGQTVVVSVEASDLVALRAGVNTWVRLVEVAERVHEMASSRQ